MSAADTVEFFFDPGCPWTWKTSRWLRDVATTHGFTIAWRPFPLLLLLDGEPPAPQWRASADLSARALRVVAHLASRERFTDTDRLYTALGTRLHDEDVAASPSLLDEAFDEAALDDQARAAADDASLDADLRANFDRALGLVGERLGSPILALHTDRGVRGFFGPVIAGRLDEHDAAALWTSVVTLASIDAFAEVKRGRSLFTPLPDTLRRHLD